MNEEQFSMGYILLVEDNYDHAQLVRRTLNAAGFTVRHAELGSDAAQMVHHERPDLILLDLDLPDIDGLEMLPILRQTLAQDAESMPPVVVVTGRAPEKSEVCAAWLRKPFTAAALMRIVDDLLKVERGA